MTVEHPAATAAGPPGPICVIAEDAFGHQVAEATARLMDVLTVAGPLTARDAWRLPPAALYVLVSGRPVVHQEVELDSLVRDWKLRFLPVVNEFPAVRVGPLRNTPDDPCLACFHQRRDQHSDTRAVDATVARHHAGPHAPPGQPVLPAQAQLVAEAVASFATGHHRERVGEAWQYHLFTQHSTWGRTTGVHGCPRCGLHRSEVDRGWTLLRDLVRTWSGATTKTEEKGGRR